MKKLLFTALMATAFLFSANAQTVISNDYGSPITGADGQSASQDSDDEAEAFGYVGLMFYSFDGFENYGLFFGNTNPNGLGLDFAVRASFKEHGNVNTDIMFNYSIGLVEKSSTQVAVTLALGPSLRMQDEIKGVDKKGNLEWEKSKIFCDCVINPKLTVRIDKVVISAGYFYWAPKFKFSKDDGATGGFNIGLGINI